MFTGKRFIITTASHDTNHLNIHTYIYILNTIYNASEPLVSFWNFPAQSQFRSLQLATCILINYRTNTAMATILLYFIGVLTVNIYSRFTSNFVSLCIILYIGREHSEFIRSILTFGLCVFTSILSKRPYFAEYLPLATINTIT